MATPASEIRASTGRKGFTLVEIMFALAVLAAALTALLTVRARTVRSIRAIESAAVAQCLAERILTERVASDEQTLGEEEGRIEGHPGYSYEVVTRELSGATSGSRDKSGSMDFPNDEKTRGKSRLYEIAVTIIYKDLESERRFSLATILYDQPSLKASKDESR